MRSRLALLLLLAAPALACKHEQPAAQVHPATEPPVPAPGNLVAEGTLRDPDAFWTRLRSGSGGAFAAMPETAAGAILAQAGVDPSLASLVAGGRPFHLALGYGSDGLVFALAMQLGDLGEVRRLALEGDAAPYRGEDVGGMVRLVPREGDPTPHAVAVTWSGYLVVASTVGELAGLGAYAARTLPTKPAPASAFELRANPAALERAGRSAPLASEAVTTALAAVARDLLPPEVDAGALAACFAGGIRETTAALGDLSDARVEVDAEDDQLSAVATLVPKPGDNGARRRLAAIHPADAMPLLDAPRDAVVTLFWSDSAEARADDASSLGPCAGRALAPLLGPGGGPKLADLLVQWARGRGDWGTASFVARPSLGGLVLRTPVADGGAASSALRGFANLASQPGASEAIRRLLPHRAGQVRSVDVPPVGKASLLMFPPHGPATRGDIEEGAATAELTPPGFAWAVDAREVDVGLGQSPKDLLAMARPTSAFRTSVPVDRAVAGLGSDAALAAIVVPAGCCGSGAPGSAPLTLGWGRRGDDGRLTIVVGDELLAKLVTRSALP